MSLAEAPLHHRIDGDGEPLLLLNGIAMTELSWEAVASPLAAHFRVVRCDFRGQLMTPGPPPAVLADHAEDVASLLDHLGLDAVHVVGTSFGGVVGTLFAARHPERARSLVTVAAADGFDLEMASEVARWRAACVTSLESGDRGHLSDVLEPVVYSEAWVASHRGERALRRAKIAALPEEWFRGLVGLLDSAHSMRLRGELAAVHCPTLVVAAERDGFVPLKRSRGLAAAVDGARFEVIAGAGHAVVVEQPQRVAELVLNFIHQNVRPFGSSGTA